jgi:multidrug efflux pump subunit AcrB
MDVTFNVIAGLVFILTAQREALPNIEFDGVIINTVYPGAAADDVQKHITISIEDEIRQEIGRSIQEELQIDSGDVDN